MKKRYVRNEKEFQELISDHQYQVFVMGAPAALPVPFATHTWLVIIENGNVSRYDVLAFRHQQKMSWGFLHKDIQQPWEGVPYIHVPRLRKKSWKSPSFVIGEIHGEENSTAHTMVKYIACTPRTYPYTETYHYLPGPNSNTYTQYILDQFPNANIALPINSFGYKFRRKEHLSETKKQLPTKPNS